MMDLNRLSNVHIDALREIGNIGAGNAATSMSKIINKKVSMQMPSVKIVTFDQMMNIIGGAEKLVVALFFRIKGEAPGTVYFILTVEEAENLVSEITNDVGFKLFGEGQNSEIAISALKEVGNIITGSYLSALSDFTKINMQPSVPYLGVDMAGAILTTGLLELSQVSDYAITINTKLNANQTNYGIKGHFLLLPDPESFSKIFTAIGINDYE